MGTLTKNAYIKIIAADIVELKKQMPNSLERRHIVKVLQWSIRALYPQDMSEIYNTIDVPEDIIQIEEEDLPF